MIHSGAEAAGQTSAGGDSIVTPKDEGSVVSLGGTSGFEVEACRSGPPAGRPEIPDRAGGSVNSVDGGGA